MNENLTVLSDETLAEELGKCWEAYRFYDNTDDIHSWNAEKAAREGNKARIKALKAEQDRRKQAQGAQQ